MDILVAETNVLDELNHLSTLVQDSTTRSTRLKMPVLKKGKQLDNLVNTLKFRTKHSATKDISLNHLGPSRNKGVLKSEVGST